MPRRRFLTFVLGWLAVGLGAIGVVLPLVPTTPFLLLALWAFSVSSRRFHDWLFHHPRLGPPLQRWRRERAIPRRVKAVALASMAASTAYVALVARPPAWAMGVMGVVVAAGALTIARIPSRPR